ncbi:Na+/H+-dicarboxylate symporter [Rhizomicrobium palustre]|uniref:Na+/H+-dicarboxylate symporter n=1 Tax=Rhizomicrobium palustre TaxID=189966 RepID=A0A846N256_9PROT|nr:dicarboxylate/amino acid:cation symporter [Rhizomicrobium palustre]NIK90028.1 Na+/H+-dicarboxylate symporter [Rhizomicrobium palustre]
MKRGFALIVAAAMVLGIVAGFFANENLAPDQIKQLASGLSIITDLFLRLIRMIIAPLVFSTLVAGIAHMEGAAQIGRVGLKTLVWFIGASILSLGMGLVLVHVFQPGSGLNLAPPEGSLGTIATASFSLKEFLTHLVPASIVQAMASNEILQIVVFSLFIGTAISAIPGKAPAVTALVEQIAAIMLKVTGYVMLLTPFAVFAALCSTVATQGIGVLLVYARFVGGFYVALLALWAVLLLAAAVILKGHIKPLLGAIREPVLLAFSTASSEAAYPKLLEGLERIGLPRKIVSFVLPLGYSFNLDGSMMYCTFATLFIAQIYGIQLSIAQQLTLLLLLMVTSKGMAGVPRASLVVIYAALPLFHLPETGLLYVLAVDHLLDMGRSGTNIVGNSVATVAVTRWEKQLS